MEYQKCPVCEGRGIVPIGFYIYPAPQPSFSTWEPDSGVSGGTNTEQCRTCRGLGIIPKPTIPTLG